MKKKSIIQYLTIILGCFIVSVAFTFFINPYKFVPGGVFGSSIVVHSLIPQLQVGTISYMISIPLLISSYFLLGKGIGVKTLLATLVTPFFMNILSAVAYPTEEALMKLDPSLLCNGKLNLTHDLILAAIIGSVLVGIGEGLIMRAKATSGGTDIIAMIIHKYLRVKFSNALLATDATIVCLGLVVIGFGVGGVETTDNSWMLSGYSLICIFIMSRTIAYVASGSKNNKLMFIVTQKDYSKLKDFINNKLDRTATVNESVGLYSQQSKTTLMMVVRMREVEAVTTQIKSIDPDAFVIVTDAYDAYGFRWKAFPDKHSIEIE